MYFLTCIVVETDTESYLRLQNDFSQIFVHFSLYCNIDKIDKISHFALIAFANALLSLIMYCKLHVKGRKRINN